LSTSGS